MIPCKCIVALAILSPVASLTGAADRAPVQDENLSYTINWPSGLSLGEARLVSHQANDKWFFEMVLDAGVPGFAVSDHFRATAGSDLCSLEFDREMIHGKRKTREKTTIDYKKNVAHRVTLNGGGKTEIKIEGCMHDALTYVFFARRELGQGRVPPVQKVFFGSQYQVKSEFIGPVNIMVNEKRTRADRVTVALKGPASDINFDIFFAQDPARTPLVIKIPFSVGMLSAELVR
jgi:hypothetical protein